MTTTRLDEHRLRRLLDVGRSLVLELDPEVILERVLTVARELTGARFAAVGILDERCQALERFVVSGIDAETQRTIGELPRGCGILSVPVMVRDEAWGNLYLTEKKDGPFDEQDEAALTILAEWAAVAITNARLYTDLNRRRDELEHAVRGLEATTAIAKAVGGETELGRVLELIVKRARALVDARTVLILLVKGDELVLEASAGHTSPSDRGARVPIDETGPGVVLQTGQPQRLADVHAQVRPSLGELSSQATAALVVPLVFRGRSSGLLVALDRIVGGPQFAAEDERLLSAFAASAATAVATAQTVEAQRLRESIRAAEEERSRWSRELHDETLQGLGALQVLLSTADRRPGGPATAIADAIGQIEEEIERLQVLITNLRPAALDDIGLVPALSGVIRRARALYGFEASLDVELGDELGQADSRLAPEIESTIYRLIQEAVNNAGKHANANAVGVRIVEGPQRVAIEIRDDGVGFDTHATKLGFGLIGMKERLSLVEGSLELESAPGQGTRVLASVPIRRAGLSWAPDAQAS